MTPRPEETGVGFTVESCSACTDAETCAAHSKRQRSWRCGVCGNVTIGLDWCRFCAQEPDSDLTKAAVAMLYGAGELVLRAGAVLRRLLRGGR